MIGYSILSALNATIAILFIDVKFSSILLRLSPLYEHLRTCKADARLGEVLKKRAHSLLLGELSVTA
jgi:hypothetical protein